MPVKLYGVYLARFQFLESNAYKIRPIVVVGRPRGSHKTLLVVPLSSKPDRENVDVTLQSWQASKLVKPTVARVHRMTALVGSNILEVIGQLETQDADSLKQAMRKVLEL